MPAQLPLELETDWHEKELSQSLNEHRSFTGKGFRAGSVSPLAPLSWGALSKNSLTFLLVPLPMGEQDQCQGRFRSPRILGA